jgi:hypothetical protein
MNFFTRNRILIDAASKIGGISLLIFYVAQYTLDIFRSNQLEADAESLSYIQRFSGGEILDARLSILSFWDERAELAQLAVQGLLSSEDLGFALMTELPRASETLEQLKRIGYFFDEVYYCHSSNICDQEMIEHFFCLHAEGYEETFFQHLRESESRIIGRDLYLGVRELSQECLELPEPQQR